MKFSEGCAELKRLIGDGTISVENTTDQVYARYQDFGDSFAHPRGGQARYAEASLRRHQNDPVKWVTDALDGHRPVRDGAITTAAGIRTDREALTPIEFYNLKRSTDETVIDNGATVHYRRQSQPRLTEQQLKNEHRGRRRRAW